MSKYFAVVATGIAGEIFTYSKKLIKTDQNL